MQHSVKPAKPLTMRVLCRDWLKWRRRSDPTDARRGFIVLPRVLEWRGADGVKLRDRAVAGVTTADVEDLRSRRSAIATRRKLNIEIVMLRRLLNFAVARGDISESPMRLVFLPLWNPRVKASVPRALRTGERPQSLGTGKLTLPEVLEVEEITSELWAEGHRTERPRTRAECPPAGEPCVFVSCRHHLAVEVEEIRGTSRSRVKLNFAGRDVDQIPESCSLRVADGPGTSREETAAFLNITVERVAQLEALGLAAYRAAMPADLHPPA